MSTEDSVHYSQAFFNLLNPPGFSLNNLQLKVVVPVILLRNLNPPKLCNGTGLQIKVMYDNIIKASILTEPAAGEIALISCIPMIPTDLPFQFKILQFSIKVSFAITINKAQG
jgi:ATP-dependent DNA helicase PIF1